MPPSSKVIVLKEGVIVFSTDIGYWRPRDESTHKEIYTLGEKFGWVSYPEPMSVTSALQTILDKNKPPGCRVVVSSLGGLNEVVVECDESVPTKDMYDWMMHSTAELNSKSEYGNIEAFVGIITKEILMW